MSRRPSEGEAKTHSEEHGSTGRQSRQGAPDSGRNTPTSGTHGGGTEPGRLDFDVGFRLRQWHVLPREGRLCSAGRDRRLAPQLMDILVFLARHQGRVVTKGELFDAVWQDAVVEEGALARCISELRGALGDDARQPRFIRTVVKRGYVLEASIEPVASDRARTAELPEIHATARQVAAHTRIGLLLAVALGVLGVATTDLSWLVRALQPELLLSDSEHLELGLAVARAHLRAGQPEAVHATLATLPASLPRIELAAAEASAMLGQHRQALSEAGRALALADKQSARRTMATARLYQARAHDALGEVEQSHVAATAAVRDFMAVGDPHGELEARILAVSLLEHRGQMAEAERIERDLLTSARDIGNPRLEAKILARLARHVWNGGNPLRAKEMFRRSIALRGEIGDRRGEASVLSEFAALSTYEGPGHEVDEMLRRARAIYRDLGDRDRESQVLVQAARAILIRGNMVAAIPALEEAEWIQRQAGSTNLLQNTLLNLGYARSYAGDVAGAIRAFEEGATLARAAERPSMQAACLEGLGFARLLAGDTQGAKDSYRASLSYLRAPWRRARVQTGLARAHVAAGELAEAERTIRTASSIATASGYLPVQMMAQERLVEILFARGRIAEAHREAQAMSQIELPPDYWAVQKLFREITIARVLGAAGDEGSARELLEQIARFAREIGAETVLLEAALARYEIARPDAAQPAALGSELATLEARAASLGLAWLERRARELQNGA